MLWISAVCVKLFRFNERGQIAYGERCVDTRGGNTLHIIYCPVDPSGPWDYDKVFSFTKYINRPHLRSLKKYLLANYNVHKARHITHRYNVICYPKSVHCNISVIFNTASQKTAVT